MVIELPLVLIVPARAAALNPVGSPCAPAGPAKAADTAKNIAVTFTFISSETHRHGPENAHVLAVARRRAARHRPGERPGRLERGGKAPGEVQARAEARGGEAAAGIGPGERAVVVDLARVIEGEQLVGPQ